MIRESRSRPRLSTPSQCSADGPGISPGRMMLRSWACGSYGARTPANSPASTKMAMRTSPATAARLASTRLRASFQRPVISSPSTLSSAAVASERLTVPPAGCSRAHPDPRVEDAVGEVDDQVHDHEDDRQEQDAGLDDREVAEGDGLEHPLAHPAPREHR